MLSSVVQDFRLWSPQRDLVLCVPFVLQQLLFESVETKLSPFDYVYAYTFGLGPAFSVCNPATKQEIFAGIQQSVHILEDSDDFLSSISVTRVTAFNMCFNSNQFIENYAKEVVFFPS